MADVANTLMTLIASLTITSVLISFFTVAVLGYSVIPFEGENLLNDISLSGFTNSTDLTSNCDLTQYTLTGIWSCSGAGLSTTGGSLIVPLKVPNNDGVYTNSYHILNSQGDYKIIVTDTRNGQYIHIRVLSDGLHIAGVNSLIPFVHFDTDDVFYAPLAGANTMPDVYIKTVYNINSNKLVITFNGQTFTPDYRVLPPNYMMPKEVISTQGIISEQALTISGITSAFTQKSTELGSALDGLELVLAFFVNILALVVWNIDEAIFPAVLNIILIKTQAIGIVICVILAVRGG